jgi:hypothetical protein
MIGILGQLTLSVQSFRGVPEGLAFLGGMSSGLVVDAEFAGIRLCTRVLRLLPLLGEKLGILLVDVFHGGVEDGADG